MLKNETQIFVDPIGDSALTDKMFQTVKSLVSRPKVLPVIHHIDVETTLTQAAIAFTCDADGVFLISHHGADRELAETARHIKSRFPGKAVGLNYLQLGVLEAAKNAQENGLDMVWGDVCGVSSIGLTATGQWLRTFKLNNPNIEVFASVAFKYQQVEFDPLGAAEVARGAGFIPTTSGAATGSAPTLEKIRSMKNNGDLAVASGMSLENVAMFAPLLSHILVATSVSVDDHHFDDVLLGKFVGAVKSAGV
jgi:hypothetical protein